MNPHPPTLNCYPASALARAAGISKVALARRLAGIPPRGTVIIHGNPAATWCLADLPPDHRNAIAEATQRAGCRTLHDYITQAPALWQPAIPLSEVAPEAVDKAAKLRRALAHVLQLRADANTSSSELERLGLADFKKEFGYSITGRTLRNLIRRTVERDNLADNFNRLEIYLDGNCARAAAAPPTMLEQTGDYRVIYDCLAAFQDPQHPRPREIEDLWDKVIILHQSRVLAGVPEKQSRFELLGVLWNSGRALAKTRNALRVRFQYHLRHGVRPDGRHARKGIPFKEPVSAAWLLDVQAVAVFAFDAKNITAARRYVNQFAEANGVEDDLAGALLCEMISDQITVQTPALIDSESAGGRGVTPALSAPRPVETEEVLV